MSLQPSTSSPAWARQAVDAVVERALSFSRVTPADGWTEWPGGACPIPDLDPRTCQLRLRDGGFHLPAMRLECYSWGHTGEGTDIVAFRLIDTEPGSEPA